METIKSEHVTLTLYKKDWAEMSQGHKLIKILKSKRNIFIKLITIFNLITEY